MPAEVLITATGEKCDRIIGKELMIGKKTLEGPSYFPTISSRTELESLAEGYLLSSLPAGVVMDICAAEDLNRLWLPRYHQTTLERNSLFGSVEGLIEKTPLIVDPLVETFRYNFKLNNSKKTLQRDKIMSFEAFPAKVAEIMSAVGQDGHASVWKKLQRENRLLSMVDWYVEAMAGMGSDIVLPPAPVFDGQIEMANIIQEINRTGYRVARDLTAAACAFYLVLNYQVFKNTGSMEIVHRLLKDNMAPHRILALKINKIDEVIQTPMSRRRLGTLLEYIEELDSDLGGRMFTLVLGTSAEGFPMLTNGISAYAEPLTSNVSPKFRSPKKAGSRDSGGGSVEEEPLSKWYGGWLHPDIRKPIAFEDLLEIIEGNGENLPHNCLSCQKYHGKLSKTKLPDQMEWQKDRRAHAFSVRTEEVTMLRNAVLEGDIRGVTMRLLSKEHGDKNLIDITPYA